MGHFRFIFEDFRPEIRQYFIEADQDALPFSRMQRSLVYQRAKNQNADKPFRLHYRCLCRQLPLHDSFTEPMHTC